MTTNLQKCFLLITLVEPRRIVSKVQIYKYRNFSPSTFLEECEKGGRPYVLSVMCHFVSMTHIVVQPKKLD